MRTSASIVSLWFLLCVAALAADFPDAAEKQDWPRIESLLAAKSDVNAAQADGTTALHWAAYHDRAEVVVRLLAADAIESCVIP